MENVVIKTENDLDEVHQMQCDEDYNISPEDVARHEHETGSFTENHPCSSLSLCTMVTIKEEPGYDSESTWEADLQDAGAELYPIKMEEHAEDDATHTCDNCGQKLKEEDSNMCIACCNLGNSEEQILRVVELERQPITETNLEKFMNSSSDMFCYYTGLPSVQLFSNLLEYIEDDIIELEDTPKSHQLFSILAKLHLNSDNVFVDEFKFPLIYVTIVDILYHKLQFMGSSRDVLKCPVPIKMRKYFPKTCRSVVVLEILKVQLKTNKYFKGKHVKYIIGYTTNGKVFYISKMFACKAKFTAMVKSCDILAKLRQSIWMVYKQGPLCFKFTAKSLQSPFKGEDAIELISKVSSRLVSDFHILNSKVAEYLLRLEGNVCFLDKLVHVCSWLLNIKLTVLN